MSVIAQAAEFRDIRLKSGEKSFYKCVNNDVGIKFPIKVDIALPAHKVSLLLQAELGGVESPAADQFAKHKNQFQQDKAVVFQHVNRLVRCIIDCQLTRGDSVAARHALELARTFAARVWDSSPLQLKQLDQIGNVAVRKLANAGINSIEALENAEAHRIETAVGRGPPFGIKLLSKLAQFPKLRVSVRIAGKEMKHQKHIKIRLKAEIGFLNENIPIFFRKKQIFACFLAETSDGQIIDFRRIAASKLRNGHEILLIAELTKPSQYISCHAMCDEIAGTCRSAEIRPNIPASLFPTIVEQKEAEKKDQNTNKASSSRQSQDPTGKRKASEDFDDGGLDDGDLLSAECVEVMDIDTFDDEYASLPSKNNQRDKKNRGNPKKQRTDDEGGEPVQLSNGKWVCNHKCKDKDKCKHLCCREGLDKPPKPSKKSNSNTVEDRCSLASILDVVNEYSSEGLPSDSINRQIGGKKPSSDHKAQKQKNHISGAKEARSLTKLHEATTPAVLSHGLKSANSTMQVESADSQQSFATTGTSSKTNAKQTSFDEYPFDPSWLNDIGPLHLEDFANARYSSSRDRETAELIEADKKASDDSGGPDHENDEFDIDDIDDALLEASMIGLDESIQLKKDSLPNNKHNKKDDSDMGMSFSSGTVHEMSASRVEQSQEDDIFNDDDDGIYDSGEGNWEEPGPVPSHSPDAGAAERVRNSSDNSDPGTTPSKRLFFTSPERPRPAPTIASAGDSASQQRDSAEVFTPTVNSPPPLDEFSNQSSTNVPFDKLKKPVREESADVEGATGAAQEKDKGEENQERLTMDGIDPSFFDEFKDFVDFI